MLSSMATNSLAGKSLFELNESLSLNKGDIFTYLAQEPNKKNIEVVNRKSGDGERAQNVFPQLEKVMDIWSKFRIEDMQRKMKTSQEHFEKFGTGVKLIVIDKFVHVQRNPNFLEDNLFTTSTRLIVDIYDENFIRNKKLEQII